uniref:hypothetical protein n=1 Tax=Alloprevotella sp. TaxID=1872471 RepID=UPI0040282D48
MKHLLYSALVALVMLAFTACSNDEIEVSLMGKVEVTVPTTHLYDNFSISSYQNFLGNNDSYHIEVRLFIYDQKGNLVKEESQTSQTFTDLKFPINNLKEGNYKVVALQTMVDANDQLEADDLSEFWTLVNKTKLSDFRVDTKIHQIYWYGALGMGYGSLEVKNAESKLTMNIEPVGSLLDFDYENMASTSYVESAFFFHKAPDGVNVNSLFSHGDRLYYENYNGSNTWSPVGVFYKSTGLGAEDSKTLFLIGYGQTRVCFGVADATQYSNSKFSSYPSGGMNYTFEWGKRYQAFTAYNRDTQNFDYFLGTNEEFSSWYQQYKTKYFAQPTTNWGTTVNNVKSFMNGYTLGNQNGQIIETEDGNYVLWYKGKYQEEETDYYFSSSTGGLYRAYVFVKQNVISEEDMATYIKNLGYNYVGKTSDNKAYVFESADENTVVHFGLNDQGVWYVCFFDVNNPLNNAPAAVASAKRMAIKH